MRRTIRQITGRPMQLEVLEARQMLAAVAQAEPARLELLGRYETGIFDQAAAEIVAYDAGSQRLFVTNSAADADPQSPGRGGIDVLDIHDPANPRWQMTIDTTPFGDVPTSADVHGGLLAIAVRQDDPVTDNGRVALFDVRQLAPRWLGTVEVGPCPDNVVFTPDGTRILVANEGQPNDQYSVDPEGSVSIIDASRVLSHGAAAAVVTTATFGAFNEQQQELRRTGVRIFGPGATVAQDLEPEYIAIAPDSQSAWITLQENNAIAKLDIQSGQIAWVRGFGYKDHQLMGNGLDVSDKDNCIHISTQPVKGMYQPDGIAAFAVGDQLYLATANEGDDRDYAGLREAARVKDLTLADSLRREYPNLQDKSQLGRLHVTSQPPTGKQGGAISELYAFGTRSFSVWTPDIQQVYDSGDDFEQLIARELPDQFNANHDDNDSREGRSDDSGPEPEAVVVGTVGERTYAFIGLERVGGIMVYDVTDPASSSFVTYVNTRAFDGQPAIGTAGDLSPEGLKFIPADKSPTGKPLLAVAYEVSGSTAIFRVRLPGGDSPNNFPARAPQIQVQAVPAYTSITGAVASTANPTGRLPGDGNRDGRFDQLDIVQVLQAGRYLTAQPATFEQGDWNGDGRFDSLDIVAALVAGSYRRCANSGAVAARDAALAE